jgi:hypothetical protein
MCIRNNRKHHAFLNVNDIHFNTKPSLGIITEVEPTKQHFNELNTILDLLPSKPVALGTKLPDVEIRLNAKHNY